MSTSGFDLHFMWNLKIPVKLCSMSETTPKLMCDAAYFIRKLWDHKITGNIYLDMLENFTFLLLEDETFQQHGAMPHYSNSTADELGDFLGIG